MDIGTAILVQLATWGLPLVPGSYRGAPVGGGQHDAGQQSSVRPRTVRLPDPDAPIASLFLPAGPGPHPALVLDGGGGVNLRAEAHRLASIGLAVYFREPDDPRASARAGDVGERATLLRSRADINPREVGALWIGRQLDDGWTESVRRADVAFVVSVLLRPGMTGVTREGGGPGETPSLEVLAGLTPLEPEVTRLIDSWLLRRVSIRS